MVRPVRRALTSQRSSRGSAYSSGATTTPEAGPERRPLTIKRASKRPTLVRSKTVPAGDRDGIR